MSINLPTPARLLLTGLSLFALAACGDSTPTPPNPTGISGVVTAPDGSASSATTIRACPTTSTECGEEEGLSAQTDASGAYTLTTSQGVGYHIIALKDVNADGVVDLGDHFGFYTENGHELTTITSPAPDADIAMKVIDENTTWPEQDQY